MDYKKFLDTINGQMNELSKSLPNELTSFMKLHDMALEDGALDGKTKELIALAISVAVKCEPCITSHIDSLIKENVTKQEIEETIAVALFMGGGPAVAYGSKALDAYEQLSK